MSRILPGYMGIVKIDGSAFRCSSCSVNINQEVESYDHVVGLNDTGYTDGEAKGETIGSIQPQKVLIRPGVISISGGISFPLGETQIAPIFNLAKCGSEFEVEVWYFNGTGRRFNNCRVNTMTLQLTAGEIINADVNIVAITADEIDGSSIYTTAEKLMTWDTASFDLSNSGLAMTGGNDIVVESFELSINNNANPVYTNGGFGDEGLNLYPTGIRLGKQEVTGNLGIYLYAEESMACPDGTLNLTNDIRLSIGSSFNTPIYLVWKRRQVESLVGPIMTSIPFVGIDKPFGD